MTELKDFRCTHEESGRVCNKLLAKVDLKPGSVVEIKCPRCRTMNREEG